VLYVFLTFLVQKEKKKKKSDCIFLKENKKKTNQEKKKKKKISQSQETQISLVNNGLSYTFIDNYFGSLLIMLLFHY